VVLDAKQVGSKQRSSDFHTLARTSNTQPPASPFLFSTQEARYDLPIEPGVFYSLALNMPYFQSANTVQVNNSTFIDVSGNAHFSLGSSASERGKELENRCSEH
jgi:hypothetical protein